ncbi:Protein DETOXIFICATION 48, partial [Mucuna pruriens]
MKHIAILYDATAKTKAMKRVSRPTTITGLLLYSRAMILMIYVGYLGKMKLARRSLSISFTNIIGYSNLWISHGD